MKFDYEKPEEEERECVAFITHMHGKPDKHVLCIRNTMADVNSTKAALWIYYDGGTQLYNWQPEFAIKKFYEGDTVTITF